MMSAVGVLTSPGCLNEVVANVKRLRLVSTFSGRILGNE